MILAIRTDKPEAELYLLSDEGSLLEKYNWHAHKELSVTILDQMEKILRNNNAEAENISGLIVYKGPGSYTGLRIGVTVANTVAYSLNIPIVGAGGDDWLESVSKALDTASPGNYVTPEYGGDANITKPRK